MILTTATVRPVTEIKRRATEIIARLQKDKVPVMITERGRDILVVHATRAERPLRPHRLV